MTTSMMTRSLLLSEVQLRKARLLPCDGTVVVKVGDLVAPQDVVARAPGSATPKVLMVGQALGVPVRDVARLIVRWAGEPIQRDEILAEKKGLLGVRRRTFRSPYDGMVVSGPHSAGEVVVAPSEPEIQLQAGIGGRVVSTVPLRGAIIEVLATYLQGIGGYGEEATGMLRAAVPNCDGEIGPGMVDETSAGTILVGGRIGLEGLMQAARSGVAGMVVGAVSGEAYKWLRSAKPHISLLVTACGGGKAMSPSTFALLRSRADLPALMNGQPRTDAPCELIVTLGGTQKAAGVPHVDIGVGATVRVVAGALSGRAGKVTALPIAERLLPSGISAAVAELQLEDGSVASVPRCNLVADAR